MTDNARIVREALEDATSPFITDGPCQASLMNPRGQQCMCYPCVKHRVREVAPAALAALENELTTTREVLSELRALVKGECPSLLDEDSGGDSGLDLKIDAILGS